MNSSTYFNNKTILKTGDFYIPIDLNLAKIIGKAPAMVLQKLHSWISSDKNYGKSYEGRIWIYNSYQNWQQQIQIYSLKTIQRAFNKLIQLKLVESKKFNNKNYDNTLSFAILYENLQKYYNYDQKNLDKMSRPIP